MEGQIEIACEVDGHAAVGRTCRAKVLSRERGMMQQEFWNFQV
jgi:hypothetical protein